MNRSMMAKVVEVVVATAVLASCSAGGSPSPASTSTERSVSTATSVPLSPETSTTASPTTVTPTTGSPPTAPTTVDSPVTSMTPPTAPQTQPPTAPAPLRGRVIVVDPGHNAANGRHPAEINRPVDAGGFQKPCNTTGTAERGYSEATFNWDLSTALVPKLRAAGATVIVTRPDNRGWGPCIDERGLTAGRHRADLLLSLHADGASTASHGFHVIHARPRAGYVTAANADASLGLATAVRDHLVRAGLQPANYVGGGAGLVARDDLGTLNRAGVPSAMVEIANMHHAASFEAMSDPAWRDRVATALTDATIDHLAAN